MKEEIKENLEKAGEKIKENAEKAKEVVKENVSKVEETVKENTEKAKEVVKENAEKAKETVKENAEKAKEAVKEKKEEVFTNVNNKVNGLSSKQKKFSLVLLILILVCAVVMAFKSGSNKIKTVTIINHRATYQENSSAKNNLVTGSTNLKRVKKYLKKIKQLSDKEQMEIGIMDDYEVVVNQKIRIGIQEGEQNYCHYINEDKDEQFLSKMPKGLYEFVQKKIK